jgi:hypothetical protein
MRRDEQWVATQLQTRTLLRPEVSKSLLQKLNTNTIATPEALQIWRAASTNIWMDKFGVR